MNKLLALLSTFVVVPVYAAEPVAPARPAAAAQPAAAAPAQPAAAQPAAQPKSPATVARAQFTTAIQDREPADKITSLTSDHTRIYFFSEIKDGANQKVTHRWEYNGKVLSETHFDVGSSRWRVFSSKTLDPSWTGEWKVSVVDEAGNTLGAATFTYETAKAAPPAGAAQPAATTPAAPAASGQSVPNR